MTWEHQVIIFTNSDIRAFYSFLRVYYENLRVITRTNNLIEVENIPNLTLYCMKSNGYGIMIKNI